MIRPERADDRPAILDVHRAAFGGDDVPRLVQELWESSTYVPGLSFVAEEGGRVVGHVMNTWCHVEESGVPVLQLSPLGVLPEFQGRGHGSTLVRTSLDAVRTLGEPLLLVEGSPKYYGRFGFVRADELGLLPPPETHYDWAFQVAILDPDAELPQGRVVYSAPFRH
ncbi:MAG TPA: N-acetyltransferase [Gaiellaceae bacterium]|nr:N-acetyltransferase [Gaiellaceae bacterium]